MRDTELCSLSFPSPSPHGWDALRCRPRRSFFLIYTFVILLLGEKSLLLSSGAPESRGHGERPGGCVALCPRARASPPVRSTPPGASSPGCEADFAALWDPHPTSATARASARLWPLPLLSLAHSVPTTRASWLFRRHTRQSPASGLCAH